MATADPRVGVVELSRNFGQHAAVLAGFSVSRGRVVVTPNPSQVLPRSLWEYPSR
jgi:hypothetical protein